MIVGHSVLQQSCLMKRKHTAGYRQHRDDEGYHAMGSATEWSGIERKKPRTKN